MILIQLVCLMTIILLGIFLVKRYSMKLNSKTIILISLFAVIKVILQLLSLNVPFFGVLSLRIGFSQIPLIVGGVILGPVGAFFLGLVVDLLGLLVSPTGFPFLGFTLSNILTAVVPALFFKWLKDIEVKKIIYFTLFGMLLFSSISLLLINQIIIEEIVIKLDLLGKLISFGYLVLMIGVIVVFRFLFRKTNKRYRNYDLWLLSFLFVEFVINGLLTPFWLELMYDIPFITSVVVRLVKSTIMVVIGSYISCFIFDKIKHLN